MATKLSQCKPQQTGTQADGGRIYSFILQEGPIKEVGENGCQIDDVIAWARDWLAEVNGKFPCRENSLAITKLEEGLHWLEARRRERERRGVEGTNQA